MDIAPEGNMMMQNFIFVRVVLLSSNRRKVSEDPICSMCLQLLLAMQLHTPEKQTAALMQYEDYLYPTKCIGDTH